MEPTADRPYAGDFAQTLANTLEARGWTLSRLQAELMRRGHKVSVATLGYWQSGRSVPTRTGSLATVTAVEELLELPATTLTRALATTPGTGWGNLLDVPETSRPTDVLAAWGLPASAPCATLVMHDTLHTGEGTSDRQHVRQLLRSDAAGVDRLPAVFRASDGNFLPEVEPGFGVRLGRVERLADAKALVVEFLLPQPLPAEGMHHFEYQVHWPADGQDHNVHTRLLPRGASFITLGVSFEGTERPRFARVCHTGAESSVSSELAGWRHVGDEVQYTVRNAAPGSYELEWYWTTLPDGR